MLLNDVLRWRRESAERKRLAVAEHRARLETAATDLLVGFQRYVMLDEVGEQLAQAGEQAADARQEAARELADVVIRAMSQILVLSDSARTREASERLVIEATNRQVSAHVRTDFVAAIRSELGRSDGR